MCDKLWLGRVLMEEIYKIISKLLFGGAHLHVEGIGLESDFLDGAAGRGEGLGGHLLCKLESTPHPIRAFKLYWQPPVSTMPYGKLFQTTSSAKTVVIIIIQLRFYNNTMTNLRGHAF